MIGTLTEGRRMLNRTGNLEFQVDLAIRATRVVVFRTCTAQIDAKPRIDACGRAGTLGVIDTYSYSGLIALADPLHGPKFRQKFTTEVIEADDCCSLILCDKPSPGSYGVYPRTPNVHVLRDRMLGPRKKWVGRIVVCPTM